MIYTRMFILLMGLMVLGLGLDRFDQKEYITNYYEENSHFPVVHVFYTKHFSSSPQFEDFLNTLEEVEYRNHDHAKILLTDCEKIKDDTTQVCDTLRRTKDNHAIIGYFPSGQFITYAGKKMQNPPNSKQLRHSGDVYTVEEIEKFISQMIPNFFETIESYEDLERWLQPRYSPNLIMVTREEEIPLVVAQLGIHFFLRFDMGYVNDLTDDVVKHLNVTSFPQLLVLKYNFEQNTHQLYRYPGKEFSTQKYEEIKTWLEPLALRTTRNDILFHKMKVPTHNEDIMTTDKQYELNELLDRSNGWAFISETGQRPEKLYELKQKYGAFFQYIHFINSTKDEEVITLYDPQRKRPLALQSGDIQWRPLNKNDFISNTSVFLTKDFVVMGVREKYSHFCTLALNNFFRGLTHCFILKEEDYEATSAQMNMQFDIGFVCYEREVDGEKKVSGNNFNSDQFEKVYLTAEYQTRLKSKYIIDNFYEHPIKSIETSTTVKDLCSYPFKKCVFLFTDSTKPDRTAHDYLKEVAKNYINEYVFYEVDLVCNDHFKEEIQTLKKTSNGLVVYHPRVNQYVYLKAKLSKTTFQRFLKANLGDSSKLPLKEWKTQDIVAYSCGTKKRSSKKEEEKSEQKLQSTDL